MRALDRKLFRDLWGMKGQAIAIAFVMAGGVATFVMSLSTLDSLTLTQATFYRDNRFADVFASLKRAPESMRERIQDLPGVEQVETRVAAASVGVATPNMIRPMTMKKTKAQGRIRRMATVTPVLDFFSASEATSGASEGSRHTRYIT